MNPRQSRRVDVDNFDDLLRRPLRDGVNAVCWRRALDGDFDTVVRAIAADNTDEDIVIVDEDALAALVDVGAVDDNGRAAVDVIVSDLRRLTALGREPVLNLIRRYARDTRGLPIRTDVHSFHADRAPIEVETWMCTYAGAPSEGLDNDAARRLIDDADVRAAVSAVDDEAFDLHYGVVDHAGVFSFGTGNLWRIAVDWPGASVPPCIHRAPGGDVDTNADPAPRLLLLC